MADTGPTNFHFPWAGLALAAAVGLGVWIVQPPLTSSRGERKGVLSDSMFGDQTADARLWQDPFEAIRRGGTNRDGRHSFEEMVRQVGRRQQDRKPVLLMTVMLSGGPYSEDSESRLRTRRALVAALGRRHWVPSDSTHLGLFDLALPLQAPYGTNQEARLDLHLASSPGSEAKASGEAGAPGESPVMTVPYEWFERTGETRDDFENTEILVWWLTDRALSRHPLLKLAWLEESLRQSVLKVAHVETNALRLTHQHFGPRSSDSLKSMLDELHDMNLKGRRAIFRPGAVPVSAVWSNLTIHSTWATAAEVSLRPSGIETNAFWRDRTWNVTNHFERHGIAFRNYITRDDRLVDALLDELNIRNVSVADPRVGLALISEYDTSYGRAFPKIFSDKVGERRTNAAASAGSFPLGDSQENMNRVAKPGRDSGDGDLMRTVYRYGYLRGLDGERSSGTLAELAVARESQNQGKENQLTKFGALERAENRGQFDYLLRLSQKLVEQDRKLRGQGLSGIRGIGVLGSDLHDKLIVLQALQPHFPQAIFFTTDLDARLLDPLELKWTRNLVVASGYGLELRSELQRPVGSFRDCYQTALFAGVIAATEDPVLNASSLPPRPLLFEIGKTRAVQLNGNEVSAKDPSRSLFIAVPQWGNKLAVFVFAMAALVFLLFLALAPNASEHWRQEVRNFNKLIKTLTAGHRVKRVLAVLAMVVIVLLPAWYVWQIQLQAAHPHGEPLFWMEGVSAWPTELLRLLIAYLCLGFCLWTRVRVMKNKQALIEEYHLPARLDNYQAFQMWCRHRLQDQEENAAPRGTRLARLHAQWARRPGLFGRAAAKLLYWWRVALLVRISHLGSFGKPSPELMARLSPLHQRDPEPRLHASDVWLDYNGMGYLHSRLLRVIPCIVIYFLIGMLAFLFWGLPFDPLRGGSASLGLEGSPAGGWWDCFLHPTGKALDQIALWASLLAFWLLIFFVLDATLLCRQFIRTLTHKHVGWAESTYRKFRERMAIPKYYLEEWIDIQVISRRTSAIMPLIYFPFFTLSIMIFSRSTMFDRWDWPIGLILMTGLNAVFVLVAAWLLRGAAEEARWNCLRSLRAKHLELLSGRVERDEATEKFEVQSDRLTKQVEQLMKEIEQNRNGAFAPVSEQPAIKALLLPFGGAGALFFLDALSYM